MNIQIKRCIIIFTQVNKKISDPSNTKEYCESYLKRTSTELLKRSKINTQQPKKIENQKTVDIKSVFIEHPKTSRKLFKAIGEAEKVSLEIGAGNILIVFYKVKSKFKKSTKNLKKSKKI